jgi:cephalosporin hydroxylase
MRTLATLNPRGVFLEIGCGQGCLAAHICEDYEIHFNLFIGIDRNDIHYTHPKFIHFKQDSGDTSNLEAIKELAEMNGGIFAVFQDSSHHYEASIKEWEIYSPLVRQDGIWICDDVMEVFKREEDEKSMVGYFNDLPGEKRLYENLHIGSCIGIVRSWK